MRMKFIEMTGQTLVDVVHPDEIDEQELRAAGVADDTIVRINQQGDIEIRRPEGWDVLGGLIGDFEQRIKSRTGLEWA
ncbi:MAG: hypothetical protein R3E01_23845 [Pirellulaceae bacterium]|nr:hypothetical protein [Planctomycetales bacterium]